MSRMNPQEYQVLQDNKFNLYCSVLGVKEQCCFAPDKKVIEKAFRKSALKCHPDKGGDPVVFKKLNEAYNKLIGHILKLEQQTEAIELANSILIEVSKTSVTKWHEKLKTRYGWFKTDNCKNIIFDGPYKQYMGRSKNTGNITVVLYEDPPDQIPKIHIRSNKYMAWIAEQQMPVHMHVEKGKTIQFDQWRIAHLAEFGICNFASATPPTPTPEKKEPPKPKPKTPKAKRREAREASERRAKTRRDSEPTPEPGSKDTGSENNKENTEPKTGDGSSDINGNDMQEDEYRKEKSQAEEKPFNCGHCGEGFCNLMDYALHKKICVPDEDFGFSSGMEDAINNQFKTDKKSVFEEKSETTKDSTESKDKKQQAKPSFQCDKCKECFSNMVWYAKHKNKCQISESTEAKSTSSSKPVYEMNGNKESDSSHYIPTEKDSSKCPENANLQPKHSETTTLPKETNSKNDILIGTREKEKKESRVDTREDSTVKETPKDVSPNQNNTINKTVVNKNDDELNPNTTKENNSTNTEDDLLNHEKENTSEKEKKNKDKETQSTISSTKANDKDIKNANDMKATMLSNKSDTAIKEDEIEMDIDTPNKISEDKPTRKTNLGTKIGKMAKPSKSAKTARTLSTDKTETDMTNKVEDKTAVESMEIDEPEIAKVECVKPLQKKNEMPMGSLLTNLPTTANPPPESDMEMGKTDNKLKQQVKKSKCHQNISKSEVPDKKSKTVVKFDLDQHSNNDNLEVSNKIFTHIDGYDEWVNEHNDEAQKPKGPLKSIMKKNSLTNKQLDVGGSDTTNFTSKDVADKNKINELLKVDTSLPNIVKNQDNKKKDQKDQGIEREKSTNGIPVIQEGLNENLTSQKMNDKDNPVNEAKKADNFPTEYKTTKTAKSTAVENVTENSAHQNVNNEKQTPTMARTKVDFGNEKSNITSIVANGAKHSGSITTDNTTNKKAKTPSANGTIQSNSINSPSQELNSKNVTSKIVQDNGGVESYASSTTISVEANKEPIEKSRLLNNDAPAHKTFTKNMAVVMSPNSKKKEISKGEHNICKNNVATKPLNSKNHNEHESESSLSNSKENSCAGKIYKEREIGHEIMEGKINESLASSHQGSKKLEKNIEVMHAKQCFVVNQPLSPSLGRKEIIQKTIESPTDDERLGGQSKMVQNKTVSKRSQTASVTNMPNTVNTESKKVVVVTPNPNDTKTRGENTRLLESNRNSYISPKSNNTNIRANLDTELEKMDKDHEVKMQKITTIMDNSKENTTHILDNRIDKSLSSISESKKILSQNSNDMKIKPGSIEKSQNTLSLLPQALQQNFSSSLVETATKTDLNKDLAKLDKQHAVKMKKIEDSVDLSASAKKMGLSNVEVNTNRPSALGPSRFDNPSKHMTDSFRENIPKRNDSIHTLKQEIVPKTGTFDKHSPPKYQISKSSTTVLDTRPLSPGLSRKKMDRNFNASPEPFFSSKSSSNVLEQTSSTLKTPANSSSKEFKENNSNKSSASKSTLIGSKSYSTMPSVASLPRPSTSFSSQTTASPSFPTVASLPKPASFSATSASSSPSSTFSKAAALGSPSNFAQSSNFDNRAKSEGSTLSTNMPASAQNNYSLSNISNKTTSDLYLKIQTTKDKHKSDVQTAMNFDKTSWKPPVIKHKYDRPDPTPSKYTMTLGRDKISRVQERERVVIDKLMMDRASRGKSDDFLKNSSYRL